MRKVYQLQILSVVSVFTCLVAQGCGGSSGGGGVGVAPLSTSSSAPVPSNAVITVNELGLLGTSVLFPYPWSKPVNDIPRTSYVNVTSGTIIAHPDNAWNPWFTFFQSTEKDANGNTKNGSGYAKSLELYYRTSVKGPRITALKQEWSLGSDVSGARWAHPNGVWFSQQETPALNTFSFMPGQGVLLPTGSHVDNAFHIWQQGVNKSNEPFRRVKIPTTAVVIGIRGKFICSNGCLGNIGLDRTPTNTSSDPSTFSQEMIGQSFDDAGSVREVDISYESPIFWVDINDPNPVTPHPNAQSVTHAGVGVSSEP